METKEINGVPEHLALIRVTQMALASLLDEHPIGFHELVCIARNAQHVPFGNTAESLKSRSLLQDDGKIHGSIRNIILGSVEGEGMEMKLTVGQAS